MYNDFVDIEFNEYTMMMLTKSDRYLNFVFDDLKKRNTNMSDLWVLNILFNTYVLQDEFMKNEYRSFM